MSDSKPRLPRRPASTPQDALDALLANPAGDPIRRALWLDGLDRQLRPHLPPSLAAHTRLANFERGKLVLIVDAPVWRAKVRLAAPQLLDAARSIGLDAVELVVKTTVGPVGTNEPPARKPLPMSAAAQEALQSALASLRSTDPDGSDDAR